MIRNNEVYPKTVYFATTYAAPPYLGVFKPGALHPVTPTPVKALPCLWFFPPMAAKSKPPALRVVGDPEHYYGKRYKCESPKARQPLE